MEASKRGVLHVQFNDGASLAQALPDRPHWILEPHCAISQRFGSRGLGQNVGRRFRAVLFVTAEPAAALFRIDAEKWPKYRPTTAAFGAHRSTVINSVLNQLVALLTAPNNATPRVA